MCEKFLHLLLGRKYIFAAARNRSREPHFYDEILNEETQLGPISAIQTEAAPGPFDPYGMATN
jgi:hypothetical protein